MSAATAAGMHPSQWAADVCLEPGPKAVLAVLARCCGIGRTLCWPSLGYLAHKCRRSARWVQTQLDLLERAGLLVSRQRGRHSNSYVLAVGTGDMSRPERVAGQGELDLGDSSAPTVSARQVDRAGDVDLKPAAGLDRKPAACRTHQGNPSDSLATLVPPAEPTAVSPTRSRSIWFGEAVPIVRRLTGRTEGGARALLGQLLRLARDDAALVLARLREAADVQPADAAAWLLAAVRRRVEAAQARPVRESRSARLRRLLGLDEELDEAFAAGPGAPPPTAVGAGVVARLH